MIIVTEVMEDVLDSMGQVHRAYVMDLQDKEDWENIAGQVLK